MGASSGQKQKMAPAGNPVDIPPASCRCSQTPTQISLVVPLANVRGAPKCELNEDNTQCQISINAMTPKGTRQHMLALPFEAAVQPAPRCEVKPKHVIVTFKKCEEEEWTTLPNAKPQGNAKKKGGQKVHKAKPAGEEKPVAEESSVSEAEEKQATAAAEAAAAE